MNDFIIIGAGIFGISTAIELQQRGHQAGILNPSPIPHPLAASTDISKVVRMEYGTDQEYFDMAEQAIEGWLKWNDLFGEPLYHEVGFLLLCQQAMEGGAQNFENASYQNLLRKGYAPQRLNTEDIVNRFPAFRKGKYNDGFYNPKAGFVESGKAIKTLTDYARQIGVNIYEGETANEFIYDHQKAIGLKTKEGNTFYADHFIVCAGAHSTVLLPQLQRHMKTTGHPVFHLAPKDPRLFLSPKMTVFAADISNTGWYGFPVHPKERVIKIALHSDGLEVHPEHGERKVYEKDFELLRSFLSDTFPSLVDAKVVYTRRCLYTDTYDGHFWIDRVPETEGLTIATGGSGHGMKMGPVIGQLISDVAETGKHQWSDRYGWRENTHGVMNQEEARNSR